MKNIILDTVDSAFTKYPLSTVGSVAMSFNWHILEPFVIQLGFLLVDYLRQRYIKKDRQKALQDARNSVKYDRDLER